MEYVFGHKNDNQTTVGAPTVQNPSMLDNVSSQDFDGAQDPSSNVQQQVEEALNKHEMKKVMDAATAETPVVNDNTFMSSPSATPTAAVASSDDTASDDGASAPPAVSDQDSAPTPTPAAPAPTDPQDDDTQQSEETKEQSEPTDDTSSDGATDTAAADADVPHPLTPAENSEIEARPVVSAVSTSASDDSTESPSAPIAPPPAPESTPELPKVQSPAEDETTPSPDEEEGEEDKKDEDPAKDSDKEASPEEVANVDAADDTETEEVEPAVNDGDKASAETELSDEEKSLPASPAVDKDKLAGMKQQALDHLEPLVDHLDQTPEEEFKTTMMRIQANDNHTLLDRALSAAKNISDDKKRAQAMLDIINEINYFSQNSSDE